MDGLSPFVTGLRCLRCGRRHAADPAAYLCDRCGAGSEDDDPGILDVEYDDERVALRLAEGDLPRADLFRYLPALPVASPGPGLPAGATPLVPAPRLAARLGLAALYLKDETRNPTRCLKDRATAVATTIAAATGRTDVCCASAGNAAISLAGFAASLGWACHVFVPSYASAVRLDWLRRFGADIHVSTGDYDQAVAESEAAGRAHGWYSRNCAFNPFLVEGKKTVAWEVADQLGGHAPDWVVAPVGDGCTLAATGKGFRETVRFGRLDRVPRLLGVQAEAVAPVVERFQRGPGGGAAGGGGAVGRERSVGGGAGVEDGAGLGGQMGGERVEDDGVVDGRVQSGRSVGGWADAGTSAGAGKPATTRAHSIAVRRPRNAIRLLDEIRHTDGRLVATADPAIAEAQRLLATEAGVVAEFTSAATFAGLLELAAHEPLAGRVAVLVITGGRPDEG